MASLRYVRDNYTYTINMGDLITIIREIEWLSRHAALFNGTLQRVCHNIMPKCETIFNLP